MGNKKSYNHAIIKIRERVYKEVLRKNTNLDTLKSWLIKNKVVDSTKKFNEAIAMLKISGRIIVKNGYVMASPNAVKKGLLVSQGNKNYVLLDGDVRQYQISEEDSKGYKNNDRVNIAFTDDGKSQAPFIISKIENDNASSIRNGLKILDSDIVLGRVVKSAYDELVFIPNDSRFRQNIVILNQKNTLSRYQDKLCFMRIADFEKADVPACGFIIEIVGEAGNPIQEYEAIAMHHGANMSWEDDNVKKEIEKIPEEVDLTDVSLIDEKNNVLKEGSADKITDLRDLTFTTVDPSNCKDMDDAIYSSYNEKGQLVVYTAVANVSKYVDLKSEIGRRYLSAGFTIYAPNRAYNILPPQLSTGICSLNPNVDRLAFVIKTVIDENTGLPIESCFLDAVIRSHQKYSYEEAQKIVDENPISLDELKEKLKTGLSTEQQVVLNFRASEILWKNFNNRHMLGFESKDEYDVKFNDDFSDILDITESENCGYHKVIEAFMLTANEASAQFAKQHHLPNIYRVHNLPNGERLAQAFEFFGYLGIPFDGDLSPNGISKILEYVKDDKREKIVNSFIIRLQQKAKYNNTTNPKTAEFIKKTNKSNRIRASIENWGGVFDKINYENNKNMNNISHFGLQSKAYSHTTSPIRRICDYVTQYNILAYMKGKELIDENTTIEIAQLANEMQDAEKEAEQEFKDVSSAIYCEKHIGQKMTGKVCGFKRLVPEEEGEENLAIIVENESKGIKVTIPAKQLLPGVKNITISQFGSAIVQKDKSKPLITLCDEVEFTILSADRIKREIIAKPENIKLAQMSLDQSPSCENENI